MAALLLPPALERAPPRHSHQSISPPLQVGYSIYGTSLDIHKPISSVIEQDAWSVVVNAGLFLHCIIAYQININVRGAC